MPKFRIASRGGTTLTRVQASLQMQYVGVDSKGETVKQLFERTSEFEAGVATVVGYDIPNREILDTNSIVLNVSAMEIENTFYNNTSVQYKLRKVTRKNEKGDEETILEGFPDAVTIILTEVPRSARDLEKRKEEVNSIIIQSARLKVKER